MGRWDELEKRLDVSTQDGFVVKPATEDLDRFEAETGFTLPDDYREYAVTFGPGSLGRGEWEFATPGFPGHESYDLSRVGQSWRENRLEGVPDDILARSFGVEAARVRRMVPFCNQRGVGEAFAWDPGDVTDEGQHEYGVYLITGSHRDWPMPKVASTFREFLMEYALGGGFERYYYGQPDATGEWVDLGPIHFQQASVRVD